MAKKMLSGAAVPTAAAGILTIASTLGVRAFLRPEPGTVQETLYRYAPAIGAGAGILGAVAMGMFGGKSKAVESAMPAAIVAALIGGGLLASERLNASRPGAALALGMTSGALPAAGPTSGLAALLPEYPSGIRGTGMGAIVMDPLNGAYGETVNIQGMGAGVRPDAFGKSPY